jgi:hypothetical protein
LTDTFHFLRPVRVRTSSTWPKSHYEAILTYRTNIRDYHVGRVLPDTALMPCCLLLPGFAVAGPAWLSRVRVRTRRRGRREPTAPNVLAYVWGSLAGGPYLGLAPWLSYDETHMCVGETLLAYLGPGQAPLPRLGLRLLLIAQIRGEAPQWCPKKYKITTKISPPYLHLK